MLFSSAYATVMGVLPPLITDKTAVISDALNHNSIINAISLARPAEKHIYAHLDYRRAGSATRGRCRRHARAPSSSRTACSACAATTPTSTGSCRSPPSTMRTTPRTSSSSPTTRTAWAAFGATRARHRGGRRRRRSIVLIGTLGKAFGVNGGYVVAGEPIVSLSARDVAVLHLLQSDHTGRGGGGARRRRPRRQRGGARAARRTCGP